jgi:hypothetical protein
MIWVCDNNGSMNKDGVAISKSAKPFRIHNQDINEFNELVIPFVKGCSGAFGA